MPFSSCTPFLATMLAVSVAAVTQAGDPFSLDIDFDDLPVGSVDGDFGLVWITGSYYPFLPDRYNCGDGTSPNEGGRSLVITQPVGGQPCLERNGVAVADEEFDNRSGIFGLNFVPGRQPTNVAFDLRQFAVVAPVMVTAYAGDGSILDVQTAALGTWSVSVASAEPISWIDISCEHSVTLDSISIAGETGASAFRRHLDFDDGPGPRSGNYGFVRFTAEENGFTGDIADGTARGNGTGALSPDGGNPKIAQQGEPETRRYGVATVAVDDGSESDPYTFSYNGRIVADFHPAASVTHVAFDLHQFSITEPIIVRAWNTYGDELPPLVSDANFESVSLTDGCGIVRVEIDGQTAFTVDDFVARSGDPCPADVNDDGIVGFDDVLQVLAAFGTVCF